jgi:WD40 repeat protein
MLEIIPDAQAGEAAVVDVAPTPCARVDRGATGKLGDCVAVGYPDHAARSDAPFTTAQVDGWIPTASGLVDTAGGRQSGYLVLKAEGSPPRALPTTETKLGKTPWAGMSGAAVFALGRLVGVVAEHHLPEGDGSLTVVPIDWTDHVQDPAERALMLKALGAASINDLEVLDAGSGTRRPWTSMIPRAPQVLVGRPAEQQQLRQALLGEPGALVVVAGMGGTGKSVLVAALARAVLSGADPELAACWPDGVVWVSVGRDRPAVAAQLELARALGEERPDLGTDSRSNLVRLCQLTAGRRGLVVLDDVWTAEAFERFRVEAAGLRVVVTTRNPELAADVGAVLVPVGELEPGQSRQLLAQAAGVETGQLPGVADALLRELGHLALGIAMTGAMAAGRGPEVWTLLLRRIRERRLDKVAHRFADNYEPATLLRAVEVAVDDLDSGDQQRWAQLAIFAGQGQIPKPAITALWSSADEDALDTDDRIDRLARRSLIQRTGNDRYLLHDLQYDVATLRLGDNLPAAHRCLIDGYQQQLATALNVATATSWVQFAALLAALPLPHPAWPVADDGYLLDHLITHLWAAGEQPSALELLGNYDWISLSLSRRAFGRILVDYEGLPAGGPLRLVRDALGRSARTVATDPRSLPDQLLGRLTGAEDPALTPLLARLRAEEADRPLEIIRSGLQPASGSLTHVLVGHQDTIQAVAVTPDGTRAVTASSDGTAIVWDLATGARIHTFSHRDTVSAVAVIRDGTRAVTASADNSAIVWDLATGARLHILTGHRESVRAVAVTRDGTRAVTASDDQTAIVWDLATGARLHTLNDHQDWVTAVAITGDGTRAVTASDDQTAIVWDLATGARLHKLTGHQRALYAVAVTGDGTRAVTTSPEPTAIVWDLATGTALHTLTGHQRGLYAVAITSDGTRAVTGSEDRTAIVWDLATGTALHTLTRDQTDGAADVYAVAVTDDATRAVTGSQDRTAIVWDLATGTALHTLIGHRGAVRALAVTPDGTRAVTASSDNSAIVWDLGAGKPVRTPTGHRDWVTAVATTGDGTRAVTASKDGTAIVWDLSTGARLHTLVGHQEWVTAVTTTGDSTRAVTASMDTMAIVWDLATGTPLHTLTGHQDWVTAVATTGDGTRAVTASKDGTAIVWDLATGTPQHTVTGNRELTTPVAITADGTRAVTVGNAGMAMVWDLATGARLHTLNDHQDWVTAVAITGDGTRAVTASKDGTAIVWDLATGTPLHTLTGHRKTIEAVAITGDSTRAVTSSNDHTAIVWDLATGARLQHLMGHQGPIQAVAVGNDDRWAVTASDDWTAAVWDLHGGAQTGIWHGDEPMLAAACAPKQPVFVIGDYRGGVHILRLHPQT